MIKFFYDSLETLQKVKFATKKDYISLGLWVVFAIIVCGFFFVGVDTIFSGAYKTFYSIMKSETIEDQIYDDTTLSWDTTIITWAETNSGITVTPVTVTTSTGSTGS
jgi:preprotein translocase SecE subunit